MAARLLETMSHAQIARSAVLKTRPAFQTGSAMLQGLTWHIAVPVPINHGQALNALEHVLLVWDDSAIYISSFLLNKLTYIYSL
jgi:hypothetical protein